MIRLNPVKPKKLDAVEFTRQDMMKIGLKARQWITERVEKGLGVDGRQMKKLSSSYRERKEKLGQPGVRNMLFSGSMLGSMDIVDCRDGSVTLGFDRAAELVKARVNQDREEWFGVDDNTEGKVMYFADRLMDDKLRKQQK